MNRDIFSFSASDGVELQCYRWSPDTPPIAVIHIAHGMGEHAARYEEVARTLVAEGYEVVAQDHRGHGDSAPDDGLGDFGPGGWERVVADQHELILHTHQRRVGTPVVLLGHSMGASLVQEYLWRYDDGLAAVVLSGTPGFGTRFGRLVADWVARYEAWRNGPSVPSERLAELLFGNANEPFEGDVGSEWLTRDDAHVRLYADDPLCGFVLRPGSLVSYLSGARVTRKRSSVARIPSSLPIYLFSGGDDPVHAEGKNIARLLKAYRHAGISVTQQIYPGGRHEMFNEINKEEVLADLISWLQLELQEPA
jgi:alpha-beta hydrolase superfamily lysophospholipase